MESLKRESRYWLSLSQRSIFCWERGRLVRIERGARTVIAARSSKKGACFARCPDGTSALPASSSLVGLKLNQYPKVRKVASDAAQPRQLVLHRTQPLPQLVLTTLCPIEARFRFADGTLD
jgi:hypothetical protein